MRKLNLTYIHSTNLAANDTSETFVVNNAVSLSEKGATVKLIVVNTGKQKAESIIRDRYNLEKLPDSLVIKEFKNRLKTKFFFYLFACFQLLGDSKDNIIITRTHALVPYLVHIYKRSRKIFFETHDFFYDLSIRDDINKKRKKRKSDIEKRYFKNLTGLICLNTHQKKLYRQYLGEKIEIAVFPTGLKEVYENYANRSNQIVYVGSLNKRSGAETLARLISTNSDSNFAVVGGKSESEIAYFRSLFPKKEFPHNVKITGWTDKRNLGKILLSSNYALLPLTDTFFNRYLTVPLKLFDYFAHGLVTLAPDYPSCSDFITHNKNGYLVDWDNISNIKLLLTKTESSKMRIAIYDKAKTMLWAKRANNQIDFFKDLLKQE